MIKANVLNVKYNNVEVKINLTDGNSLINTSTELSEEWLSATTTSQSAD